LYNPLVNEAGAIVAAATSAMFHDPNLAMTTSIEVGLLCGRFASFQICALP